MWIWSMDDARVYIWHIDEQWRADAKYRRVTINDDGTRTLWADVEARNKDNNVRPADEDELAFIRRLTHARFVDVDKRDHQIDLTEDQVVNDLYLKHRCGKDVIIPMPLASIDRKKPWIGYTLPNLPPGESGDNRTRGIAHHDEARTWWHEHTKSKRAAKAG